MSTDSATPPDPSPADPPRSIDPFDVVAGTVVIHSDVVVTVLADPVPWTEPFGRPGFIQFLARRHDTGREGYVMFGPGAQPLPLAHVQPLELDADPSRSGVVPFGGWTYVPDDCFDPCAGGHVQHTWDDDGTDRCSRCGRQVDHAPCGCGDQGHESLGRSYCENRRRQDTRSVALRAQLGQA